jgi:hypothetical protein
MRFLTGIMLLAVAAPLPAPAHAQGLPTTQPGVLTIFIEELKVGMDADHEANEAGWPAAFAKAGSPHHYLALEAMTGAPEVWFVSPYASWSQEAESMKLEQSNPTLAAELKRLWKQDGQYLASTRTVQAVGRPDLSYGAFPDMALQRFYEITTFRIRPGHDQAFEAAVKVYANIVKASAPAMSFRMYQVTGGMPGGTYLAFGSVDGYARFDAQMADGQKMWEKVSPQDMATLQKTMSEDVMSTMTNRYSVSPTMSYVPADARSRDPAFWK